MCTSTWEAPVSAFSTVISQPALDTSFLAVLAASNCFLFWEQHIAVSNYPPRACSPCSPCQQCHHFSLPSQATRWTCYSITQVQLLRYKLRKIKKSYFLFVSPFLKKLHLKKKISFPYMSPLSALGSTENPTRLHFPTSSLSWTSTQAMLLLYKVVFE